MLYQIEKFGIDKTHSTYDSIDKKEGFCRILGHSNQGAAKAFLLVPIYFFMTSLSNSVLGVDILLNPCLYMIGNDIVIELLKEEMRISVQLQI